MLAWGPSHGATSREKLSLREPGVSSAASSRRYGSLWCVSSRPAASAAVFSDPSGRTIAPTNTRALAGVTLTLTNTLIAADDGAANVSSFVGFFPMPGLTIDSLYQKGVAYPLRWYSDVAGTPAQPQKAYEE